jgi:hypothetical protein
MFMPICSVRPILNQVFFEADLFKILLVEWLWRTPVLNQANVFCAVKYSEHHLNPKRKKNLDGRQWQPDRRGDRISSFILKKARISEQLQLQLI